MEPGEDPGVLAEEGVEVDGGDVAGADVGQLAAGLTSFGTHEPEG